MQQTLILYITTVIYRNIETKCRNVVKIACRNLLLLLLCHLFLELNKMWMSIDSVVSCYFVKNRLLAAFALILKHWCFLHENFYFFHSNQCLSPTYNYSTTYLSSGDWWILFGNVVLATLLSQWRRLHGARAPHFYKWLGMGSTMSRRTKQLIVLLEPKWRGTTKKFFPGTLHQISAPPLSNSFWRHCPQWLLINNWIT